MVLRIRPVSCPDCGEVNRWEARFCRRCGKPADAAARAEALAAAAEEEAGRIAHDASSLALDLAAARKAIAPPPEPAAAPAPAAARLSDAFRAASAEPPAPAGAAAEPPEETRPERLVRFVEGAVRSLRSETAVGERWLLVVGLLLVVAGVGLFLKYAFERNWIGPEVRCAGGFLFGLLLVAAGTRWRTRLHPFFGNAVLGGGFAVSYLSSYFALDPFAILPAPAAFLLLVALTAASLTQAVLFNSRPLAVLAAVGGYLAPVLASTGEDRLHVLMPYLLLLGAGLLGVARKKDWPLLSRLGATGSYLLFAGWHLAHGGPSRTVPALAYLTALFLLFSVLPFAREVFGTGAVSRASGGWMVANTLAAFGLAHAMIEPRWGLEAVGLYAGGLAAYFLGMATFVRRRQAAESTSFRLLAAQGVVFTVALVPMILDGHWTTLVWALQGATLLWAGGPAPAEGGRRSLRRWATALLVVAALKSLSDVASLGFVYERWAFRGAWADRFPGRLALYAVLFPALGWSAVALRRRPAWSLGALEPVTILANAMPFLFANVEVGGWFEENARRATFAGVSVLWGLWSAGYLAAGFRWSVPAARRAATVLFFATAAKVVLVDLENAATPYRIVSFVAVGGLLVGASYLYYRLRDRFEAAG